MATHIGQGAPILPERKDPDDVWDVRFVWDGFLDGATPDSFSAFVDGVTLVSRVSATEISDRTVENVVYSYVEILRVSGGVTGTVAQVTSRCNYNGALVQDRSVRVTIEEQ